MMYGKSGWKITAPAPTEFSAKNMLMSISKLCFKSSWCVFGYYPLLSLVRSLHIAALHAFFPELQKYMFSQPIQGKKSENANPLRNMFFFQNRCSEG